MVGQLKCYNASRQFGFITIPGLPDVFFHANDCDRPAEIPRGAEVEFLLNGYSERPQAVGVRRCAETIKTLTGRIRTFDWDRYFGFISVDGTQSNYFFHGSAVLGDATSLNVHDHVEFEPRADRAGRRCAVNVRRIG